MKPMYVIRDATETVKPGEPIGFRLRSTKVTFGMQLVELRDKPIKPRGTPLDPCPTCNVVHHFGTIHLHFEPGGTVIVSVGILESLQKIGLESLGLTNEGAVKPPSLGLGVGKTRPAIDQENRRIRIFGTQGEIKNG